jgi:hypothetical protein
MILTEDEGEFVARHRGLSGSSFPRSTRFSSVQNSSTIVSCQFEAHRDNAEIHNRGGTIGPENERRSQYRLKPIILMTGRTFPSVTEGARRAMPAICSWILRQRAGRGPTKSLHVTLEPTQNGVNIAISFRGYTTIQSTPVFDLPLISRRCWDEKPTTRYPLQYASSVST